MKQILQYSLFVAAVLLSSCEDHRMDGIEPDKVFLIKRGLVTESVYNIGETVTSGYWTYKSGYSGTSCTIDYNINEELLKDYNLENGTAYMLLPENCYTLGETRFTISEKSMYAPFSFTYDPALVLEASNGVYEASEFALPIHITSSGVDITNETLEGGPGDRVIVVFNIKKPEMNILRGNFEALIVTAGEIGTANYTFEVGMPFISKWTVNFGFSSNLQVLNDAVDDYNVENGVDYRLLDDDTYQILTENLVIPVGGDRITVDFNVDRTKLNVGNFVLPLVLSDISSPLFAGADSIIFLPVRCVADRITSTEDWSVTASTYNAQSPPNPPRLIIDGNLTTNWHVVWKGQNGGLIDPDPWVTIDMKEEKTIYQVEIYPVINGHISGYQIYTSTDGNTWTGHGFHDTAARKSQTMFLFDLTGPTLARFVKVGITNNEPLNGGNTVGLYEVYVRGF